ncbi:MAG: ATP-binding cassette domain-containing protein [Salibacteraceae bacterium]
MDLRLQKVVPVPLRDWNLSQSGVWNQEVLLECGKSYLVTSPSGKGKSTLLNLLYGIRRDFDGEVVAGNRKWSHLKRNQWATLRQTEISMVFQGLRLLPQLSGWENLRLKSRLPLHVTESRMREMVELLGIVDLMGKKCAFWSYGQRQRLAIIRALLQPFHWLLLDEPFSHLDRDNIALAAQLIQDECQQRNAGVLIASLGDDYELKLDAQLAL